LVTLVTGPSRNRLDSVRGAQVANDIAVRIEDTYVRHGQVRHIFLAACLAQQVLWREGRGFPMMLVA
jgi:hypothetical protein